MAVLRSFKFWPRAVARTGCGRWPGCYHGGVQGRGGMFDRRYFLQLSASVLGLAVAREPASAQVVPNPPVHFVVGFAAGGPNDIVARIVGEWLANHLGVAFIIENRVGSGGMLAAQSVINAPPDGYTIMFVAPNNAIGTTLYKNLTF